MDPSTSWPHSFIPILQAPSTAVAVASSSSQSGHLVQGLIPSSARGHPEWSEYGDLHTQEGMNFEFQQQRRSDAFDPFPEQQAPARSDAARLPVGGEDPCAPHHRLVARMGPPCADSNAALPATTAMTSSSASGNRPIATCAELPSTSQPSGSVRPFQNTGKLSMPDVQVKALSRSDTQIHLPSARKSEYREESPPSSRVSRSPTEAPRKSADVGANSVLKRPRVAAEPPAASQQPRTHIMQSQPVRSKEKVGERITALQQLVSPYGKTDTASVLSEAIGYIKFLQEQVQVLSSPYIKRVSNRQDPNKTSTSSTDAVAGSDLRSRGLCLVPVSCTLNVASSNGADYWASGVSGSR